MKTITFPILVLLTILTASSLFAENEDSIPIHGFFNVDASYNNKTQDLALNAGALNFYLAKNLNNKINVFIDLVFEYSDGEYITDLERMNIGYDVNQYLQMKFGKFHSPYGYWNTAFHHGLQLQTSILRPKFLSFEDEGGILPSHGVGILASGEINDIGYSFYLTSGSRIEATDSDSHGSTTVHADDGSIVTNEGESQDSKKLYGVNISYPLMEDIYVGLHSFYQEVNIFNDRKTKVFMYGTYMYTEHESLELSAEAFFFNNKNTTGTDQSKAQRSHAMYAQIAYDFNGIKPYFRTEITHYAEDDFYFQAQKATAGASYRRNAIGINYSLAEDANIKLALIHTTEDSHKDYSELITQFAVRF